MTTKFITDQELSKYVAKVFSIPEEEIKNREKLFSNTDPHIRKIFYILSKLTIKQYVDAALTLEYLLSCSKRIEEE